MNNHTVYSYTYLRGGSWTPVSSIWAPTDITQGENAFICVTTFPFYLKMFDIKSGNRDAKLAYEPSFDMN